MASQIFGLSPTDEYAALVVAPGYTPSKLRMDFSCQVTTLRESSYLTGYLLEKDGLKIAWIKISSGACNLIDHLVVCAELRIRKMIFIGSVGALKVGYDLGDICTPSYCVAGGYTNAYLNDSIKDFVPFEVTEPPNDFIDDVVSVAKNDGIAIKKAAVFCTDSIALEYCHLDEIKSFGTDLIEMETSSFYRMADLFEIPSIAILVVSDNSASGIALVGKTEEEQARYDKARTELLPRLILKIAEM